VFFRGGYVGACLIEEGRLSVGWVMQGQLMRIVGSNWPAQSSHLARQSSLIGDLIQGARPLFDKPVATASIPYGYIRTQSLAPQVFPIGDQLGVVPSFTGDGMALALHTGWAAARAVLAGRPAADYQRDFVAGLRRQFLVARGLGRLLEMTATSPFMVAAAAVMPSLVTKLAAATRFRHSDM
jgi:menaquinone-9 beta-reductase